MANLIWAVDTGERGTIASQVVMSLAHRKRDGLESMIYKLGTSKWAAGRKARARGKGDGGGSGEEEGEEVEAWGRGEVSGMLANFKSATWICAPQIYGLLLLYLWLLLLISAFLGLLWSRVRLGRLA